LKTDPQTVYQLPPLFDTPLASSQRGQVPRSAYRQNILQALVPVVATLATTRMPYGRLRRIEVGALLDFDLGELDSVTLTAAGRTIARGNCVTAGARLGVRVEAVTTAAAPPTAR
jgi:flagellar motor switch/type III secretory pathway protein FliN